MITKPLLIDWRLIPVNTKIIVNDANLLNTNEFSVKVPFDGEKLIGIYTKIHEYTKKVEQHEVTVSGDILSNNCFLYGIPDRLYPDLKRSSKTILELISEETLPLSNDEVKPLISSELKTALSLQVYRKTTCTIISYNDSIECISSLLFKINPKQVTIYLDSTNDNIVRLDLPNPILFEAVKKLLLEQAV